MFLTFADVAAFWSDVYALQNEYLESQRELAYGFFQLLTR